MRLLISVVDAGEARVAATAGADISDVRAPSRGALGDAAPAVARPVRQATPSHLPVSAALGDGPFEPAAVAALAVESAASGAAYVKLGLRETSLVAAAASLEAARARPPAPVPPVVARLTDFPPVGAPAPRAPPGLAR